ncbi:hypothetical protein BGX30_006014, partial [Mortierella sp. GBA39]
MSAWMLEKFDSLVIMNYRNHALGGNGIVENAQAMLREASTLNKKIVIAVETVKSNEGPRVSFYSMSSDMMDKELQSAHNQLAHYASYAGFAIHDFKSWQDMKRILGQLAKAGLVLVQHGGTGAGWKLARLPEEISLLDVYEAVVQTPLFELHHSQPNPSCIIGHGIQPALQTVYEDSEEALKRRLAQESIRDLVASSLEHGKR